MSGETPEAMLAAMPAATVYEAAGKTGDVAPAIRLVTPGLKLAGPARTVRCMPGDMTAVVRAIDDAGAGDVDELIELELPVFAASVSVRGTVKSHPGWLGVPIAVGDAVVAPGDFVIGDSDGVVIVPAARLEEVALKAQDQRRNELAKDERARSGEPLARIIGIE